MTGRRGGRPPALAKAREALDRAVERCCRIEFSDTLAPAPWTDLGSDLPGTASSATVTDPNAVTLHPTRIYRVRIINP
jgi:hypothetical protein